MKLISHRGNLFGRNKAIENHPTTIDSVIAQNYNVEVDVWLHNQQLYLGHDCPEHVVSIDFFIDRRNQLLIHCKNDGALFKLQSTNVLEVFAHANDAFTLTSRNKILVHPHTKTQYFQGTLMMPEMSEYTVEDILKFDGLVTDNVKFYENCFDTIGKQ